MDIDVYSHTIKVTKVWTERDLQVMMSFCRPLVEMGFEKRGRKFIPVPVRTYAAATRNRKEFSFHRNQLEELKQHITRSQIPAEMVNWTTHTCNKADYPVQDFQVKFMYPPRENQPAILEYVLDDAVKFPNWDAVIKMVALQTGKGKELKWDTHVRVPGGWQQIRLLKVGDWVVSRDGSLTKVTGVYPQGKKQLYEVEFWDGRKVKAGAEHQWQSFYVNTSESCRWQIRNTLEMKRLIGMPNPRVYIPLIEPEELPEQSFVIPPYLLGVLIGDGLISTGSAVAWSKPDRFIADEVKKELTLGTSITECVGDRWGVVTPPGKANPYLTELKVLELAGSVANNKFIPSVYLSGSIEQRLHLIQGLMDTDGTVQKSGSLSYSTVSQRLAEDVQYLVRSLGGIAAINPRQTYYTHDGEKKPGQLCYEVDIRHTKPSEFLRLPRKRDRVNDDNQYSKDLKLRVRSITAVEEDEAYCISVDHPEKLYVVKDFIVTHNTYIAQYCMNELKLRTVLHFKGGYVERWKGDLEKTFEFKRGLLLIVRGSKDLIALMRMQLEGTLKAQVIIITTATMREYFKDYEESNGRSEIYPIKPIDFYPKMQVGFRVGDEIHQEFFNNFKIDLYTHVVKSLSLSATMESSDQFKNKMAAIAYPPNQRHDGGGYDAYIAVTAWMYQLDHETKIRYMGAQGYSHTTFEESVMKNPRLLKAYLKIIERVVYSKFIGSFEHGQKMLVFCATTDMCTIVMERLKHIHTDFNIVRYAASLNDPYDELLECDIGVSTIGSAGTAIDLANLKVSLMTTAIDSRQSNEQVLGRTRRLVGWPDITPEFIYLVCMDIEQHQKYMMNKKEFFKGKVVSHGEMRSGVVL